MAKFYSKEILQKLFCMASAAFYLKQSKKNNFYERDIRKSFIK
jgi:hypothetical protein